MRDRRQASAHDTDKVVRPITQASRKSGAAIFIQLSDPSTSP